VELNNWDVDVYRLPDSTFEDVLTTASITIIDKRSRQSRWRFFDIVDGAPVESETPTGGDLACIPYRRTSQRGPGVSRGLSPGTQKGLVLTEALRARHGLEVGLDVVPCAGSFRTLPRSLRVLDETAFNRYLRDEGARCWLVVTDQEPSRRLGRYLDDVPLRVRDTATCNDRLIWWKFTMPAVPQVLVAQTFQDGDVPKHVRNEFEVRAVGGIAGLFRANSMQVEAFMKVLDSTAIGSATMAYAKGLRKLEIGQLNSVIHGLQEFADG
jgi:hypothetical protein